MQEEKREKEEREGEERGWVGQGRGRMGMDKDLFKDLYIYIF